MKVLFVLLVGFPWVTAQYQVCPYVDPSSSQIAVISDRFHLILYLHELKPLDNLVNNLKTLSNDIRVFITIYLESELKNKRDQFNVNYTLIKKFVPEAARTDLWNFFHKSQNNDKKTSKILIVMSELYFTHSMEESLEQLKKAGVEIFILHYGKVNYDLHPIASSPKEQHIYRSLKFEELDTIQAELAQSVCVSIQNHDLIAKRERK
ncbi:Hypothetical predicted protein [Pelobates cultripes]|uniref:VWFA domain-containing protein n=1 Tax=Pelobates cultripes TaxID=61616 RepID=A0AAD1W4E9_PELCU|nr:Hypothetical predicted protein [Pelobates cultripes]